MTEGVYRALQQHLNNKLYERQSHMLEEITTVDLTEIHDKNCRFYYDALATIHEAPKIAVSEEILSFPVVWVGINDRWYGASNINTTLALRSALQLSLFIFKMKRLHTELISCRNPLLFYMTRILLG